MSFDWKSLLKGAAPMIGTALGGPAGGIAAKLLVGAFDKDGKTDASNPAAVDKMMQGVVMDPANVVKLKELETNFQAHMAELGYKDAEALAQMNLEDERVAAKDRDSARAREVAQHDAWTPRILGGIVVGGFLWTLYWVLSGHITALKDPTIATVAGSLIGYASAKADMVISYYFGSSSSSARKDTLLYQSTPTKKS